MKPALAHRLRQDLRTLVTPGRRMADEIECVASVLLAIALAHLLRAALRMIGTLLGATLAIWFERLSSGALWQVMLATAAVGGVGLFGMLTGRHAYAWLLFGLTFLMIVLDRLKDPDIEVQALAVTRVIEVGAGTLACLIVSLASTLTARRLWPAAAVQAASPIGWHPDAARHALQAALALALLPAIHHFIPLPELAQAGVTIVAVMIVPVAGIGASGLAPVSNRLRQRAIGCLCGGALAAAVLLLSQGWMPALIAGTCLGIVVGRHIENGGATNAYVGLQFTLAVLVVLVPDDYANAAIEPGLERLASVFIGMAILLPILLGWHLLAPGRKGAEDQTGAAPSE